MGQHPLPFVRFADILSELDEMEREEFFRLKKIQDKKAEKLLAEKREADAYEQALLAKGIVRDTGRSILDAGGGADEDLLDM